MFRLSKHNVMQIATDVSELINQHVNIMDQQGYIIASTDKERVGMFHEGAKKILDHRLEMLVVESDDVYLGTKKGINLPILVEDAVVGVIGMTGEPHQIETYVKIIKRVTEILVVEAYRKEERLVLDKIRNRYIEEWLLESDYSNQQEFMGRGLSLGIDITMPRRVMMLSVIHHDGKQEDTSEGQRLIDKIEKKIRRILEEDNPSNLMVSDYAKMVCIVARRSDEEMLVLGTTLQDVIRGKYQLGLAVGIDQAVKDYTMIREAYLYAKKALEASYSNPQRAIKRYDEINVELFINEIPRHLKEEFVYKIFRNVSEEGIRRMIPILETLMACNGSLSLASAQLFMHKNTLQYKLNRLHEKTGYDPRNLKDLPLFYIAILFCKEWL